MMVGTHDLFKPWIPKQANFRQKRNDARKGSSCPSFDTRLQRLNSSSFFNTYMVDLDELNHGKNIGEGEYGNVFLTNLTVKAKFFKVCELAFPLTLYNPAESQLYPVHRIAFWYCCIDIVLCHKSCMVG